MKTNDSVGEVPPSPGWVRPADVMRVRKLRTKRHALQARMSSSNPLMVRTTPRFTTQINPTEKRNPFRRSPAKTAAAASTTVGNLPYSSDDLSTDATLFNLLHQHSTAQRPDSSSGQQPQQHFTFTQALRQQGIPANETKPPQLQWQDHIPLDWCLKTRIRFITNKPLPWKHNFKTSEEASGTTGMTRCLWGNNNTELDTSPNAEFYQRCLVWQQPSLPGVSLFPRDGIKAGGGGAVSSTTGPYADTRLSTSLHASWCEALRSLHQLLRVRQCPYFYVCAPTFTVVFRAAGVCSIQQAHALVTPTTRGLRNAMREEGIDFKMPLCRSSDAMMESSSSNTLSSNSTSKTSSSNNTSLDEEKVVYDEDEEGVECGDEGGVVRDDGDEEATSFLANLGVDTSQFANLNPNRTKATSREIDRSPLSMVYVADPDTQGLTNFLLNSSSCVAVTGPLAGVPPTLLAPVAFQGATLVPFKVKGGSIRVRGALQYSMEVTGPLLPHAPVQLATLLSQHSTDFTMTTLPLTQTLPFSSCTQDMAPEPMTKAFAEEGLVDCGLDDSVRSLACQPLRDGTVQCLPPHYRHVTYQDHKYTWTDKQAAQL